MDIRQLLRDLRQNFIVVFLAFAVCVVAGGAAAYLPAKQYQASTNLYLTPTNVNPQSGPVSVIGLVLLQLPTEVALPSTLNEPPDNAVPAADRRADVTVTAGGPARPPTSSPSA